MAAKNPLLTDPQVAARFAALPPDAKAALYEFVAWLYGYAGRQTEQAWQNKKAPMAVYWSAVKAWAFHIRRVTKNVPQPAGVDPGTSVAARGRL